MVKTHEEMKSHIMQCVTSALAEFQKDLELRIARKCRYELQFPANVGVNMAQTVSKEVRDLIEGIVVIPLDKKIDRLL